MNPTLKSSIIIIVTLLIGVAIGFELSEISVKRYMEQMRRPRAPEGFLEMFNDVIKPDQKQKPVIDSILIKYHNRIEKIADANMSRVKTVIDSMHTELKTKLTAEQAARLDNEMSKMRPPGPPHEGKGFAPFPPERGKMPPPEGHEGPGRPGDGRRPF